MGIGDVRNTEVDDLDRVIFHHENVAWFQIAVDQPAFVRRLQSDKKTRNGMVHFVLPTEIGKVEVVNNVPEAIVLTAVDEIRGLSQA